MHFELTTDAVIENLVNACGENATAREKHFYRETLRSLVRLARTEQMAEIKTSVGKLTGSVKTEEQKID